MKRLLLIILIATSFYVRVYSQERFATNGHVAHKETIDHGKEYVPPNSYDLFSHKDYPALSKFVSVITVDSTGVQTGFINEWWESGPLFYFDDFVPVESGIVAWWSMNTVNRGWFYGYNDSTKVAHATGITDISEITDASIYTYEDWAVGPVSEGDFVLFHNTISGYYAAFEVNNIYGDGNLLNVTWYFQADGSPDFSSFAPDLSAQFLTENHREGVAPYTIQFTDLSTATDSTSIISWEWDFNNDGITDSGVQNPGWTYDTEGTYSVSLTVSDGVNTSTWLAEDFVNVLDSNTSLYVYSRNLLFQWSLEPVFTRIPLSSAQYCDSCLPFGYREFDQTWGPIPVPASKTIYFNHVEACDAGNFDLYIVDGSDSSAAGTLASTITLPASCGWSNSLEIDVSFLTGPIFFLRIDNQKAPFAPLQKFAVQLSPPVPEILSITPNEGAAGALLTVDVAGQNTAFVDGISELSFSGTGIAVLSTTVTSSTELAASIQIDTFAPPGFRDVRVTTGSEVAVLVDGFFVSAPVEPPAALVWIADGVLAPNLPEKAQQRGMSLTEVQPLARTTTSHLELQAALEANGKTVEITNDLTSKTLSDYSYVFAVLGIFPNNHIIHAGDPEATQLENYLAGGGRLYIEGGDVWFFDPNTLGGHDFGPSFSINATDDGADDFKKVLGACIALDQHFLYAGQNNFIDHIALLGVACTVHSNDDPAYGAGVAFDNTGASYRTIGNSFEFGGLRDNSIPGATTKVELMQAYLDFFDNGYVTLDISVEPESLDFGGVPVGSSLTLPLKIKNDANATENLLISAITPPAGTDFSVSGTPGAPIPPGDSASVDVAFSPATAIYQSGDLLIESNDPDENPLAVPLSGTGLPGGCDPLACADAAVIFPMPEGGVKGDPVEGSDGDTIWVDIQIKDNPQAIGAFGFIVQVNPAQLAFISAEAGDLTGGFVVVDAQENFQGLGSGVITCGGFGTTPVPVGSAGSLIRLRFEVSCAEGDSSDITISDLSDDVVSLTACCNRFYCVVCISDGDVNNDGNLTPGDALCAFKTFLNGQVVPAECDIADWDCEVIAGDVNCDGTVTPGDALSIFQRFLDGFPPLECFAQAGSRLAKRSQRTEPYRLSLVQRTVLQSAQASGRDLIELSLRVDDPEGLAAFGLGLTYPAEKLDFLGIRRTALTQEWIELDGRSNAPGELLIGGFNIDAVETVGAGDLFELTFASKGQSIRADEFGVIELTDDISDALLSADASGLSGVATVPTAFKLYQSYPNPFQGHSAQDAVIRFDLAGSEAMQVELSIYNITGQMVRRLVTGSRTPGQYEISWDGRNDSGLQLPSGTYFYRLKAADFVQSRYLSVVR